MKPRFLPFLLLALAAPGCGDDGVCGPEDRPAQVSATISPDIAVEWNDWRSSPNNDCGEAGGPTSLTVEGSQVGASRAMVLCLPRPDRLGASAEDISDDTRVRLIDLFADAPNGCLATLDRQRAASGTVAFPGLCGDGQGDTGYGLEFDISVPVLVDCMDGSPASAETMTMSGAVAVSATSL